MPLMSFAKTLRQLEDGTKTVTRRDGWLKLRAGHVVTPVEFSSRNGSRWFCETCKEVGPVGFRTNRRNTRRRLEAWQERHRDHLKAFRLPKKLPLIRALSVRRERLGDITSQDVAREGLPLMNPKEFVEFYSKPGKPEPERLVTRIEFQRIEKGATP